MTANLFASGTRVFLCTVSLVALTTANAAAQSAAEAKIAELESTGTLLSGDKHNHTTCSDGSTSVEVLVNESILTYELDWFAQTGHGGEGVRDCRFTDPEYDGAGSGEGDFWENTVGVDALGGDVEETTGFGAGNFFGRSAREMWRWQSLTEYAYPTTSNAGRTADEPVWLGIETVVPGHEHASMAILDEQINGGNAYATGQFEYLWDRADEDTSGGDENDFENPENNGVAKNFETAGILGHERAVDSVEWMREFHQRNSYYVPAHVERQGGFDSDGTRGFNVEHFRNFHNAGLFVPGNVASLSVAFGAEMIGGHQSPRGGRGTYEADRPSAGLGTYGGAGAYAAAEVTVPGTDPGAAADFLTGNAEFDQTTPLTLEALEAIQADLNDIFDGIRTEPSGADLYDSLTLGPATEEEPEFERYVFAQPGVRTMWDALLAEGRKFWVFGSSDWHNRGEFGPFEPQSTLDFFPGEYQKIKVHTTLGAEEVGYNNRSASRVIAGMQQGNHFSVMGDLIDKFYFVMCQGDECATMGQTLRVSRSGPDVELMIKMTDPEGVNNSPYSFPNPSIAQLGVSLPINEPTLAFVDVIRGDITGEVLPDTPEYTSNVSNPTTEIFASFENNISDAADKGDFTGEGDELIATMTIPASDFTNSMYFRVRGTNMPKGTPFETDANGNPLLDDFSMFIPCFAAPQEDLTVTPVPNNSAFSAQLQVAAEFDGSVCPDHLPVDSMGVRYIDADVEAWSDLWFYANPIFVRVRR